MAHWVGAQGQPKLARNAKTFPYCDVLPRERQTQNEKVFFNLN